MVALSGFLSLFTPSATTRSASMSRPESVSSRIASLGSSTAICRISFRFFSPPEKPVFTDRVSIDVSMSTNASFCSMRSANSSGIDFLFAASLTDLVVRGAEKIGVRDARDLDGILEREEDPRPARAPPAPSRADRGPDT